MVYYQQRGSVPPKRHTQHRASDGSLYLEELIGEEGFASSSSLLYHCHIPSALVAARRWMLPDQATTPNEPLVPRHIRPHGLFKEADARTIDMVTGRRLVLGNDDVRISYVLASAPSPLYRNATGDDCIYIQDGAGIAETVFGSLPFRAGDYVLIPRATTHRWLPDGVVRAYCIEARSHITPARRYLSQFGQLLEHAPYCERDLHGPGDPPHLTGTDVELYVKHRGSGASGIAGTIQVLAHHPFDVVGWDGCLYPYTFNIADFMPITGKVHQPPPAHQVFEGAGFVICNFVPRKADYHPLSIPVPYYHSNVDSDEVMFYCGGDYQARTGSGIGPGSITLHPGGHTHGPHPGAYERSIGAESFNELAVMIDTFSPLRLGECATTADDGAYAWSWSANH